MTEMAKERSLYEDTGMMYLLAWFWGCVEAAGRVLGGIIWPAHRDSCCVAIAEVPYERLDFQVSSHGKNQTSGGLHTATPDTGALQQPAALQGKEVTAFLVSTRECSWLMSLGDATWKSCVFALLTHTPCGKAFTLHWACRDWRNWETARFCLHCHPLGDTCLWSELAHGIMCAP